MTMRERMLAVVQRREHDRVPFVQYSGLGGPDAEAWELLGKDNMGILRWMSVHTTSHPNCRFETENFERDGRRGQRTTLHTPAGTLTEERLFEPALNTLYTKKHYVEDLKDYEVLCAFLQDTRVHENYQAYYEGVKALGEDGLPHVSVDRTPFQQLWIQWVGLENLCLHLADAPDIVERCLALMGARLRKTFEIVRKAFIPYVVFPDNITAPAIGVHYFNQYCVPYYRELAWMLADKDTPVFVHMDGNLKPLWKEIGESGIRGIDSLSPPPDNDTSAGEAVQMWPDMRLFVNYPSSMHLASPQAIYDQAMALLTQAGHSGRLTIQISENVPPGAWRKSYPQIVKAIRDFGKP